MSANDPQSPQAQSAVKLQWELVRHYLSPIEPYFRLEGVTGIFVNRFDSVAIWTDSFSPIRGLPGVSGQTRQDCH